MRIAIVGLGGVGGYLAAYLENTSNDIVGFARNQHLKAIQTNGIKIVEDSKTFEVKLDARELNDIDGYFDVVLFCVKSFDLQKSYKAVVNNIDSKTIILSFSNGVDNGDKLREISDSIVLDACIYILSHIQQSGVIRKNGDIFAAIFGGDKESTNKLKSVFDEANLRAKIPSDIKKAIYKKYIFISAFASLTTYFDESIVEVCQSHLIDSMMVLKEIAEVAHAQGIDINDEVEKSLQTAKKLPYDSSTSMHLDFKKGKKMEIDTLCGYVVKEGDRLLIETPFMKNIYTSLVNKIV